MATILVVEDYRQVSKCLEEYWQERGHIVRVETKIASAYYCAVDEQPQIVFLDYHLEVGNGSRLARIIKKRLGESAPHLVGIGSFPESEKEILDEFIPKTLLTFLKECDEAILRALARGLI